MSDAAIKVRRLGKKYRIRHQEQREPYMSLREVLMRRFKNVLRRRTVTSSMEDFWALSDVSFEIKQGEAVGIIGRNGAGKSTLLKLLSRITEPTTGSMEMRGRVASLLEVGTGFHQELTGRENIFLNGSILGMSRSEIRRKFDEIVAFAEVDKFLDTPVKRYSSGMYVRLAFAVAAHLEPEILVVDEVLAVGDAEFQKKCLGKMGEVASGGRTVLFVSHQINAVEQLCNRVIQLQSGRLKVDSQDIRRVTRDYLFGSNDTDESANSQWIRSNGHFDHPCFTPLEFYLGDAAGNVLPKPVSNVSTVCIYLRARIEEMDPALTIGFAVYAENGELLFWSYQTDGTEGSWPKLALGEVVLTTQIPSRLLNEGAYRIELIGGLHHREWIFEPGSDTPTLTLQIQGGLSESPLWSSKRPGLLAPVLKWKLHP